MTTYGVVYREGVEWWLIVAVLVVFVGVPLLLGVIAVTLYLAAGLVVLVGSGVVSLYRLRWQWWVPGWAETLAAIAEAFSPG